MLITRFTATAGVTAMEKALALLDLNKRKQVLLVWSIARPPSLCRRTIVVWERKHAGVRCTGRRGGLKREFQMPVNRR